MPKLCQIIAVANGKKSRRESALTYIYHQLQRGDLFTGLAKTYRPKDEDGDQYPSERKRVQHMAHTLVADAAAVLTDLFDTILTQDEANCEARGSICIDGVAILPDVPVTYLLFLEKQLVDVRTIVDKLPIVDPAKEWHYSESAGCLQTRPIERTKTKKVPKFTTIAEATEHHPAQVDKDYEDIVEGYWETVEFSGAVTFERKRTLLERVEKLIDAVKAAREEANAAEIRSHKIGEQLFGWLLAE